MGGVGEREDTSGTRALVSSLAWAAPKRLSAGAFARALAPICEGLPPAQLPVSLRAVVASREAMAAVRASPLGPLTVFQPLSAGAAPRLCESWPAAGALVLINLIYQAIVARKGAFPAARAIESV